MIVTIKIFISQLILNTETKN